MKKFIKIIFSLSLFFIFNVIVYADTFSWTCEYIVDGQTVQYSIKNLDAKYLIGSQKRTEKDLKGNYSVSIPTKKLSNNVGVVSYLNASIKNNTVVCPTLYKQNPGNTGGAYPVLTTNSEYCDDTVTGCIGVPLTKNTQITLSKMTCKNDTTGKTDSSCSSIINQSTLYPGDSTKQKTCEYKINSSGVSSRFALTYNSSNDSLTADNLGTGYTIFISNSTKLKQIFKESIANGRCPTNVACKFSANIINDSKSKLYVGPNGDSSYRDDDGTVKKFSGSCGSLASEDGQDVSETRVEDLVINGSILDISDQKLNCKQLMGDNLTAIVHLFITLVRIAGAIIAIISGMLSLIPAITSNDAGALKKATQKCVLLLVILVAIGLFPTIITLIGKIAGFDLTCFVK